MLRDGSCPALGRPLALAHHVGPTVGSTRLGWTVIWIQRGESFLYLRSPLEQLVYELGVKMQLCLQC